MRGKKAHAVRGFTLIELVIVIAVIAILAALLVPTILGQAEKARMTRARDEIATLGKAIVRIRTNTATLTAACLDPKSIPCDKSNSSYVAGTATTPCTAACSPAALSNCNTAGLAVDALCWGGPYVATPGNVTPVDPWNHVYRTKAVSSSGMVTLASDGPDGVAGNTDDITQDF